MGLYYLECGVWIVAYSIASSFRSVIFEYAN